MKRKKVVTDVVFVDLTLNALLAFVALFVWALIQINPESVVKPTIETRGKFLIVIEWDDGSRDDVDIYVQDPTGKIVYFRNRDTGLMHLEYDDLGSRSDTVVTQDGEIKLDRNEERAVLRGTIPGEYIVNVHMYRKTESDPTKVTTHLYQLIGNDKELHSVERTLTRQREEQTAFRFTITPAELVRDINVLPKPIIGRLADPRFGGQP